MMIKEAVWAGLYEWTRLSSKREVNEFYQKTRPRFVIPW